MPARERLLQLHVERLRRDGRWVELLVADPAAEDAHRALMRAALEAGDRVAAARQFRRLRDELSKLGLQPEEETLALAGELAEGPAVEAPLGERAPILGRDAELGLASRVLQQATAGRGTTLVVTGDAGIGKTRFVDAVLALARRRGWHTLRGAAHGDHADVPYRPLVEALEVLLAERPDLLAGLAAGAREALGRLVPAAATAGGATTAECSATPLLPPWRISCAPRRASAGSSSRSRTCTRRTRPASRRSTTWPRPCVASR